MGFEDVIFPPKLRNSQGHFLSRLREMGMDAPKTKYPVGFFCLN